MALAAGLAAFGCAAGQKTDSHLKQTAVLTHASDSSSPAAWWEELKRKPDSWYRSDEGRRIAENILSWQDKGTGWPSMDTAQAPFAGDTHTDRPSGLRASLVKATVNEMRFLARGYRATRDERYLAAVLGGLKFILDAQYPSGGWPYRCPAQADDYSRCAAYADDVMTDLMTLLQEVGSSPDFRSLDQENRQKARQAFEKGIEFIMRSQVRVNDKPTAWAGYYDPNTCEPRPGRMFDAPAICSDESAGVLLLLMGIRKPSPEVIEAIEAGAQWYRDAQISGLELASTPKGCRIKSNASAPPLWARFYEIGTNRPIFAGGDGIVRHSTAEIPPELRLDCAWYTDSGRGVLARYEEWRYAQKWRNQPPTNTDESQVQSYTLPDPLQMADGGRVRSVSDWEKKRRPEIVKLFEQHQHGVTPSRKVRATCEVIERDASGMGGLSRRTQVRIHFSGEPDSPVIRVLLNVPAAATRPVPTLLYIGFSPNVLVFNEAGIDEGMVWHPVLKARVPDRDMFPFPGFDAGVFLRRGYGIATVYYGDIDPDFDHGGRYGVRSLFGKPSAKRRPDEWGSIGAWAWGLSRVLDYLQTDPAVDSRRVAVAGVSRLGKAVLWAAAQDQRFAMAIPMLSGEGGAALSRRNFGETIADLTNPARYHYWYAPRYADYAFDVNSLPVDGHMLVSLIAPRPVLLIAGAEDNWSDPRGEFLSAKAAEPVYALYGKSGLGTDVYPAPDTAILNDMGFFLHRGGHAVLPEDLKIMADFMDRHFQKSGTP
jgi:PelA/Pel-15E family pectate lyase